MKRIVTGFLLTFFAFAMSASAQVQSTITPAVQKPLPQTTVMNQAQTASSAMKPGPLPDNNDQPLSTSYKTEAVSYLQDTTDGNWWVYAPVLNQSTGDSTEFFLPDQFNGGESFYLWNDDSIGPLSVDTNANPTDPPYQVPVDTMYNRVMGIRVTPPTDLGSSLKLDSANVTFFAESINPTDKIQVWAVSMEDEPLENGNGTEPFPALISQEPLAEASIPASEITAGQMNALTVSFGGKTVPSSDKNEMAICVFVDGPNFPSDTIGYLLEADANPQITTSFLPDTSGSQQLVPGPDSGYISMRTYLLNLDAGNVSINGNPPGYIGGGGQFFTNIAQNQSGALTGSAFFGNIAITTYFHGTALAGVSSTELAGYGLGQVYPNPVSTTTAINYNLGQSGPATLEVYNELGQNVGTLVNSVQGAGEHSVTFSAGTLPDGMYYYKLQSGEFTATNSMVIAR